jgi:type IV conjugative transfer system protein TraE
MDFKLFADHLRDIDAKYRLLLFANVLLAVMVAGLAVHASYLANRTRVIVIPSHLNAKVELQGESASPEYTRIMALHMTNLLYTYTPYTIATNYQEFMVYVPAERWESVKAQLQQRIDQVGKLKINETFLHREFLILKEGECLVAGKSIRWSAGQELATEDIFLRYQYKIINGGFRIEEVHVLTNNEYNTLRHSRGK